MCNNPSAVLWYHPLSSPSYTVTSTSLNDVTTPLEPIISKPPSTTPPPQPPPPNNFLQHILEKYHNYASIFSPIEVEALPEHHPGFNVATEIEDSKSPPFGPLYHLSKEECEVLFNYVKSNLHKGFIHHSTSPATSPILFVHKKSGKLHLCINYCRLNAIMKKN